METSKEQQQANEPVKTPEIDMSKVTPEGLLGLVHEMGNLKREIAELKEKGDKTRLNPEMGVLEFNWCIDQLTTIKSGLGEAKEILEKESVEEDSKIIRLT